MVLASGAHVKLDTYEFQIDKSVDSSYVHRIYNLQAEKLDITGWPGKQQLGNDTLMWTADDWAGGEGNRIYYQDDFDKYFISGALNPRIRGELTARPLRAVTSSGSGATSVGDAVFTARGNVYRLNANTLYFLNVNTLRWVTMGSGYGLPTAGAGDFSYAYTLSSATLARHGPFGYDLADTTSAGPADDPIGAALMDGTLYGWTGAELWNYDIANWDTWAADHYALVHSAGATPTGAWGSAWYGDIVATENSLVYWRSAYGVSEVFEYKNGVGYPLWTAPKGFAIRSSCYQNGVVYFAGHWGAAGEGWGALYAIPLDSFRPTFLKWIGKLEGLHYNMPHIASSYGNEIILSSGSEHVYVYDAQYDSLSVLDFKDGATFSALITYGDKRFVGDTAEMNGYDDDEPGERATGFNTSDITALDATLTSSKWDYDYPTESKTLVSFHLTFSPLLSGQFIDVAYKLDDATDWTALTQVTASTPGASTGRVVIPVSVGGPFYQMQYRVTLTSSTGVLAPILYGITAETALVRKREEWELVIRLKDESSRTRPSHREVEGPTLRDWLESVVQSGTTVTFLDGYRYENVNQYTTETVIVKEMTDVIVEQGEGSARIILMATTEAT